jgi:hypothetical protein
MVFSAGGMIAHVNSSKIGDSLGMVGCLLVMVRCWWYLDRKKTTLGSCHVARRAFHELDALPNTARTHSDLHTHSDICKVRT